IINALGKVAHGGSVPNGGEPDGAGGERAEDASQTTALNCLLCYHACFREWGTTDYGGESSGTACVNCAFAELRPCGYSSSIQALAGRHGKHLRPSLAEIAKSLPNLLPGIP